jgi:3-methyladenine DNA glycosylase AlkD
MLMDYFADAEYCGRVFSIFDTIDTGGYYVKMAVAWALSLFFVRLPDETMAYLKNNNLDDFTYNKSLQKIIESRRVGDEAKQAVRAMKRK